LPKLTLRRISLISFIAFSAVSGCGSKPKPPVGACGAREKFDLWPIGKALLRGANVFMGRFPQGAASGFGDGDFSQADFDDLARAGANYLQISHAGLYTEQPPYSVDAAARDNLDIVLRMAANAHLFAVIAFRSGPGRNENAITGRNLTVLETIWTDPAAQAGWVEMMRYTASRYKDNPTVIGYDPLVEPNDYVRHGSPDPATFYAQVGGTIEDFNGLSARVTRAVREVDATTPILLEPEGYGDVPFLPYLVVTGDARTVYTVHDYAPFEYTHQLTPGATYPGQYDLAHNGQPVLVDRARLDQWVQPVRAFSSKNQVPVAFTEFGAHRTAANVGGYLQDRIGLQDAIGNWAAWTWQPAGFLDPYNMHDPSAAHDALHAAWSGNCPGP
jgi:hypothetical protein